MAPHKPRRPRPTKYQKTIDKENRELEEKFVHDNSHLYKKDIELTEKQKEYILANWDKMDFMTLVKNVFKNEELDGRSLEGRAIKAFLITRKLRVKTSAHPKVPEYILSEEEQSYIVANASTMRPIEIARVLFKNQNIAPLSREVRAINKYLNELDNPPARFEKDDMPDEDVYVPPYQISAVVNKVNKHTQQNIDFRTMSMAMRKSMESLRGFLQSPRFCQMINSYTTKTSREIFESEFVRGTWDKPDLTPDELNLYVNLCSSYVLMITINRQLDMLNEKYEAVMRDEDGKITQALAEMIKVKTDELNKCDKRQQDLVTTLNGKRAERKAKQKTDGMSIARLIAWWQEEENRIKAIQMAEKRMENVEADISLIESMSSLKAAVFGLSKNELTRG